MSRKEEEQERKTIEAAKLILSEEDFNEIMRAIKYRKETMFIYNKREGGTWLYRQVRPTHFMLARKVYLWSGHKIHHGGHSFRAWEISHVYVYGHIVEALLDMNRYKRFWNGLQSGLTTLER